MCKACVRGDCELQLMLPNAVGEPHRPSEEPIKSTPPLLLAPELFIFLLGTAHHLCHRPQPPTSHCWGAEHGMPTRSTRPPEHVQAGAFRSESCEPCAGCSCRVLGGPDPAPARVRSTP